VANAIHLVDRGPSRQATSASAKAQTANGEAPPAPTQWLCKGGRATWTDGARSLNGRLDHVFQTLEQRAIGDDWAVAERRRRIDERQREEARRAELVRISHVDEARFKRATAEMNAWRTMQNLAAYNAALRDRIQVLPDEERDRIHEWCDWIEQYVARSNPVQCTGLIVGLDD
jgi:hypothetical protein